MPQGLNGTIYEFQKYWQAYYFAKKFKSLGASFEKGRKKIPKHIPENLDLFPPADVIMVPTRTRKKGEHLVLFK